MCTLPVQQPGQVHIAVRDDLHDDQAGNWLKLTKHPRFERCRSGPKAPLQRRKFIPYFACQASELRLRTCLSLPAPTSMPLQR